MKMSKQESYLTNLPKVDKKSEIQTDSFKALNGLLPTNKFCLRDERIEDYGVDASLEVLEDGGATNFRAQVQLKGTQTLEPNKDGSYSLGDIATSNLQYLLNAPISIYILHIQQKDEFRFVWARDEFKRLKKENPEWLKQKTITLRFTEILDTEQLQKIREQIIKKSTLNRSLSETLLLTEFPNVIVEIDAETLEITDQEQILKLIAAAGMNLINEGYGPVILDKIGLLDPEHREQASVRIVRAYAEYASGHYGTAKEVLALLKMDEKELSDHDSQIASWMEAACDYQTGVIGTGDYTERLGQIASRDDAAEFSCYRFEHIRRLLFDEGKPPSGEALIAELRQEFSKLSEKDSISEGALKFKFLILQAELGTIVAGLSKNLGNASMRKKLGLYSGSQELAADLRKTIQCYAETKIRWYNELDQVFELSDDQTLKADINVEKVLLAISELSLIESHSQINGIEIPRMADDDFKTFRSVMDGAIEKYSELRHYERKLRAQSCLAELLRFNGYKDEADAIFSDVATRSRKMGYAQVERNAENPLSKMLERIDVARDSFETNENWANKTDEQIAEFANDLLERLGLPDDRLPNVLDDAMANRDISREKVDWCENIYLIQDLTHTESRDTYYAQKLEYFGKCSLHNYESALGNSDHILVVDTFKKTYCETCPDRSPCKSKQTE